MKISSKIYDKSVKNFKKEFKDNISLSSNENLIDYLMEIIYNKPKRKMLIDNNILLDNLEHLKFMPLEEYSTFVLQLITLEPQFFIKNHLLFYTDNAYYNCQILEEMLKFYEGNLKLLFVDLDKSNIIMNKNKLAKTLLKNNKDDLINNIDYFIYCNDKLLRFKKILTKNGISTDILNDTLNDSLDVIAKEIILNNKMYEGILKREKIIDTIKIMIKELCENENVRLCDIEEYGSGSYSAAYKIGNKILKVGEKRVMFDMPNNKRFLKPLYRKEIPSLYGNNTILCVEITELVDIHSKITDDEIYEIYKEFRDLGYVWTDIREDNLGRLLRDNEIYFSGIDYVDKEATSYYDDQDETLKAGEVVIIDNDLIFTEEQFYFFTNGNFGYAKPYEERYQQEMKNKSK